MNQANHPSASTQASTSPSKKRLALAIIDFLSTSLKDGTLTPDDAESIEVAQSCIADTFHVDPTDKAAMQDALGGQSLLSIFSIYEKLKGKSAPASSSSSSSSSAATPSGAASSSDPKSPPVSTPSGASSTPKPPNPEAESFKSRGNSAMAAKDYASAINLYTQALTISPTNPIYLSNRAAAYSASGSHLEAQTDAEMAVASDPKYTKAWSRLGLARFALGDAHGAMEAYEKGIEFEGNGGSDAMRKGYETAKRRVEEEGGRSRGGATAEDIDDVPALRGPPGGSGGMPDLSALAGMFGGGGGGAGRGGGGGGGGPDLSSIMNNPMFASMAQNLMSNPDMMSGLMNNPRLRQMADQWGGGGDGSGRGMPDVGSLMQDPNIAELARNLMGGRGGGGAGGPPGGAGRGT
ncbi:hypothetical protein MMC25_001770 [Agyrium rufum]|nr:hypothetical protein [Agyrium rufum]